MSDQASIPRRRILPPHIVRHDFLSPAMVARLFAAAQENEQRFKPAKVGAGGHAVVQPDKRISTRLRKFGPVAGELEDILRPLAPQIAAALGVKPFAITHVELELVAHGDGAFYTRHIDTMPGASDDQAAGMRLLSGVYYFHAMPKAFEGGALRLHEIPFGAADAQFIDLQPEHNSLAFFPSWMPHEVMKVSCPSGRFIDSRFAINCWFRGKVF